MEVHKIFSLTESSAGKRWCVTPLRALQESRLTLVVVVVAVVREVGIALLLGNG